MYFQDSGVLITTKSTLRHQVLRGSRQTVIATSINEMLSTTPILRDWN